MQGPLHWEAEKGDVSQVEREAAMLRLHWTRVQGLV